MASLSSLNGEDRIKLVPSKRSDALKILATVHQFLPKYTSGTEILTFEACKGLREMGHEVRVLSGVHAQDISNHSLPDDYEVEGLPVTIFRPRKRLPRSLIRNLQYRNDDMAVRFGALLDSYRPDLVHCFHLHHLSFSFVDECIKRNIPVVVTPTAFWPVCPYSKLLLPNGAICSGPSLGSINCVRHYLWGRQNIMAWFLKPLPDAWLRKVIGWFQRYPRLWKKKPLKVDITVKNILRSVNYAPYAVHTLNMADRILVPNAFMAEILQRYGLKREKLRILPYGINDRYHNKPIAQQADTLRIGFIGSLSAHKGLHVLADALALIPAVYPLEVKIYGEPRSSEYVDRIKCSHNDPRMHFLGTFSNGDIGTIFSGIDILVIPSIWVENSPLVMQSAQASGCPVIASDVEGINSYISDQENGLLFPVGDASALAKCLLKVLEDRELLSSLRARAKRPLSMDQYCKTLDRIYREL